MGRQRKQYTGAFKAKIAVEAIKGQRTVQELATAHGVHPNQITTWKKHLQEAAEDLFSGARERRDVADEQEKDELYRQIGKLQVQFGCKKSRGSCGDRGEAAMDRTKSPGIEHRRAVRFGGAGAIQLVLQILGRKRRGFRVDAADRRAVYEDAFYGSRRMTFELGKQGGMVNRKRVQRLMRLMGLEAIYPKPRYRQHIQDTGSIRTCCVA
ncbi:MAG TPA: IS3 family transposase [Terriglobia bacterium]|jgi:putative transposase